MHFWNLPNSTLVWVNLTELIGMIHIRRYQAQHKSMGGLLSLIVVGAVVVVGAPAIVAAISSLIAALTLLQTQLNSLQAISAATDTEESLLAAVQQRNDEKQLVCVPPDHWLMATLCQAKRLEYATAVEQAEALERHRNPESVQSAEELKVACLTTLLTDLNHDLLTDTKTVRDVSARVVRLAGVFSELLSEYEPLLVEVALVHCLREWSGTHHGSSVDDVEAFEAYLTTELRSERVANWFGLQFLIDTVDVLLLSRHFYKEKFTNQALRDLISISIVESGGDSENFMVEVLGRVSLKQNKAVADAWTAWLGEEIATVGIAPRCSKSPTSLAALNGRVINTPQFDSSKRAYFPFGLSMNGIGSNNFGDLRGVINLKTDATTDDITLSGFIYEGGELLATEDATVVEEEEEYEVIEEGGHPHEE